MPAILPILWLLVFHQVTLLPSASGNLPVEPSEYVTYATICIVPPTAMVLPPDLGRRYPLVMVFAPAVEGAATPGVDRVTTLLGMYPKEGNTIPWFAPCPQEAIAFSVVPAATVNGAV